jgi:hypothetical protein
MDFLKPLSSAVAEARTESLGKLKEECNYSGRREWAMAWDF